MTCKHPKCPSGSSNKLIRSDPILCVYFLSKAQPKPLNLAANCEWKPCSVLSLDHRTISHWQTRCIAPPVCCRWDASIFPGVTGAMIEWDSFCLQILFFSSLSSTLFSCFAVYDQYITVETFFLCIIQPPSIKNCECILYIFHHLQCSFSNSSLIELSSFDLKVSQVSFLVKKKSVVKRSSFI